LTGRSRSAGARGFRKSSYSSYNGNCVEVGGYRKSTHSVNNGNCVEVGNDWRKSSRSEAGNCVEVGQGTGAVVRDTVQEGRGERTELAFPAAAWRAFLRQVKDGGGR
jgi:hypothetical protein